VEYDIKKRYLQKGPENQKISLRGGANNFGKNSKSFKKMAQGVSKRAPVMGSDAKKNKQQKQYIIKEKYCKPSLKAS